MADDQNKTEDAVFRIFINADIQRVWRELTKTGEAQGAVFNAWLHTSGQQGLVPGARPQMRTGSGRHVIVDRDVVACEPPHMEFVPPARTKSELWPLHDRPAGRHDAAQVDVVAGRA